MTNDEFNVDLESANFGAQPVNKTIMWVEDDSLLSDMISRKITINKCTLLHANNAEQAMSILNKTTPDIIILDILLPGKNGLEVLADIKSREDTKNIPIIVLSNFGQKEEIEKSLRLGAEKYLVKATLNLDEILIIANEVLNKHIQKPQA